jgi:RecA/RadA recombinase
VVEYAGVDGSGRETLAAAALARAQQQGCLVLLVDPANTADPDALVAACVELGTLTIASPATAAQA